MKIKGSIFLWIILLLAMLATPATSSAQSGSGTVLVLTAKGPLTPAMVQYLDRGIRLAEQRGIEALVFQLDTPGGSIDLMGQMVQSILSSPTPVIVYVAPRGAIAGSAGTVITLAGHVAVMAPETAIGAASPVGAQGEDLGETVQAKAKNALKAQARSLAERRGAEAIALAEETIETAAAASASEALAVGMIDFIARDLDDLLQQVDGFVVSTVEGERPLNTANALVDELQVTFIESLLSILTNPNIVFLLVTIGLQSILIEISSPGGWVAGFIGVVCLTLATYGLGVLDVNWFGIIFLVTAFVLFLLDIKAPTHGALTAAAVGSLIVGTLVLFNSPGVPGFQRVSVPLVVSTSLIMGLMFFGVVMFAVRAQRSPIRTGQESMVGRMGITRNQIGPSGIVQCAGERWTAQLAAGETPIPAGQRVKVVDAHGLTLIVRRADQEIRDDE
jgi:membrane-bound serine protease (ClpP class)